MALALTLWGVWHADHMDEYNEVFEALRIGTGHLNLDRWVKRVYCYILFVEYGLYFAIGRVVGLFSSVSDFSSQIVRDLSPLLILGRITSALFVTTGIWCAAVISRLLHSRTAARVTVLFCAVTPMAVELAHFARIDGTFFVCSMAALLWMTRFCTAEPGRCRDLVLAAFFAGLTFQARTQGVFLLLPLAALLYWAIRKADGAPCDLVQINVREPARLAMAAALGFLGGMVLGNPAILVDPMGFVKGVLGLSRLYTEPIAVFTGHDLGFFFYGRVLWREFGPLLSVAMAAAVLYLLVRHLKKVFFLMLYAVPMFLVLGASRYAQNSAYLLPLLPVFFICFGIASADLLQRAGRSIRPVLAACLVLLFIIHPVVKTAAVVRSFSGPNTRVLAKQWIEKKIPPHSKILMDSGKSYNTFAPLIAEDRQSITRLLDRAKKRLATGELGDKRGVLRPESLQLYEMLLTTVPPLSYDITTTGFGLYLRDLKEYRQEGFDYFIMNHALADSYLSPQAKEAHPESARFYLQAQEELHLLHVVRPSEVNRGDSFFIYSFDLG